MAQGDARFARQIMAFGEEGQRRIASTQVAIVGLGGIGSQVIQALAFLGTRLFLLIDDDIVEETNLNRLVGATKNDVRNKVSKVDVASRVIEQIGANPYIRTIEKDLRSPEVIDILTKLPSIIFGCVDNDGARYVLTEIAAAYEHTLIDSAAQIWVENQQITGFGGRVVVAQPGDFCLLCANQIDMNMAQQEMETDAEKAFRDEHGYGLGREIPDPAIFSVNATVAGLAVTEFMCLVTGMRAPHRMLTHDGMRGVTNVRIDKSRMNCRICNDLAGQRHRADVFRFSRMSMPKDLPT